MELLYFVKSIVIIKIPSLSYKDFVREKAVAFYSECFAVVQYGEAMCVCVCKSQHKRVIRSNKKQRREYMEEHAGVNWDPRELSCMYNREFHWEDDKLRSKSSHREVRGKRMFCNETCRKITVESHVATFGNIQICCWKSMMMVELYWWFSKMCRFIRENQYRSFCPFLTYVLALADASIQDNQVNPALFTF